MQVSWSYSSFSAALKCLQYYKLVYIDKLVIDKLSGDLEFGTSIHLAVNQLLVGEKLDFVITCFDEAWNLVPPSAEYGRFKKEQLRELGIQFINNFYKYHLKNYTFEGGEKRLYSEYKGIKLEGTPDYYGLYKGQPSLRDFKTSGYRYGEEKEDIALQLYLYAYLAKDLISPKTLGYTVLNKGTGFIQDMTWDFSEKKMYEMLDQFLEYANVLNVTTYPKNFNSCLYPRKCDMYSKCFGVK